MNTEIANRLCAYRKHHGLSQEELADRIGVSRQAVSKWERTEASPDTDNLIRLSQIYGVTLDDLLYTDPGEKAEEAQTPPQEDPPAKDHISFKNGIHIRSSDGDRVDIDHTGIHITEGQSHDEEDEEDIVLNKCKKEIPWYRAWCKFPFPILCVIVFLLLGFLVPGAWAWGWLIFLVIPLYYSLGSAIVTGDPHKFAYPVLATLVYLFLGLLFGWWHPTWLLFLTIPLYYMLPSKNKDPD